MHSPIHEHLDYILFLAILNITAVTIHVQVFSKVTSPFYIVTNNG
jgi:hypothetical protein